MPPTQRKSTSNEIDVYNSMNYPITIDEEGHQVGGGEWATVEGSPEVKAALKAGYLIEPGKTKAAKESDEDEDDLDAGPPPVDPNVTVSTVPPGPTPQEK